MKKLAIISGASGGIGSAIARKLSNNFDLLLLGRNENKLIRLSKNLNTINSTKYHICDVRQPDAFEAITQDLLRQEVTVSVLIQSCGIVVTGGIMEASESQWMDTLQTGLMATVRMIKAFVPLMKDDGGNIVIVNGSFAKEPDEMFAVNSANNPALLGLAKATSKELAPLNIRVNSILPGPTETPLWNSMEKSLGASAQDLICDAAANIPLKRVAQPDDVANVAEFLCSPEAKFITGADVRVDGGATLSL